MTSSEPRWRAGAVRWDVNHNQIVAVQHIETGLWFDVVFCNGEDPQITRGLGLNATSTERVIDTACAALAAEALGANQRA